MALQKPSLKQRIIDEFEKQGFVTTGEYSRNKELAEAIANAVVDEIQQNSEVTTSTGTGTVK